MKRDQINLGEEVFGTPEPEEKSVANTALTKSMTAVYEMPRKYKSIQFASEDDYQEWLGQEVENEIEKRIALGKTKSGVFKHTGWTRFRNIRIVEITPSHGIPGYYIQRGWIFTNYLDKTDFNYWWSNSSAGLRHGRFDTLDEAIDRFSREFNQGTPKRITIKP